MPLRLVVPMEAAEGKRDELIESFHIRSQEARQENGCEEYELYQSTERPDQLVLLERWADQEALDAHLELNKQKSPNTAAPIAPLRTGVTKVERYLMPD